MSVLARPLVAAFLAYLAALLVGLRFGPHPYPFAALAAGLVPAAFFFSRSAPARPAGRSPRTDALLGAALVAAGLAAGGGAGRAMAADCRMHIADGAAVELQGVLLASVVPGARGESFTPRYPVRAALVRVDGRALPRCAVDVRATVPEALDGALAGTAVRLAGSWRAAPRPAVPSRWPRQPRFAGALLADDAELVAPGDARRHPLLTMRGRAERTLHLLFPSHGALADALLLGRRETLDPAVRERYTRAGLAHLLAISGAHVGLLAGALLLLGRAAGLAHRVVGIGAIGLIVVYLATIGAPASALRAGTMIVLAVMALLLQRPTSPLVAVAAAAWLILGVSPGFALDLGFQMSVAGVTGILLCLAWLEPRLREGRWSREPWRSAARAACVSVAAFAATAPLVGYHFAQATPVSIVSNMVAMPVLALALVGVAAAAVLAPLTWTVAALFADGAAVMLALLDRIATHAAAVPGGYISVARGQVIAWLAAAAVLLLALHTAPRLGSRLRGPVRLVVGTIAAAAVTLAWPVAGQGDRGAMEIHFLDVGQGDAVAIRSPRGRWVLVDAGPRSDRFDAGARRVVPFLRARGARRVELMVLTHPHLDHIGGAPAVMREIPVARLLEPGMAVGSTAYLEVLETAEQRGVAWLRAESGRTIELDGVELRLLWPDPQLVDDVSDANEISVVVHVRYGEFAALLTGDAYADVEALLVDRHGDALRSQLLKAGHHGSRTSTSDAWLDVVRPELAVVSAGRRNRFGHPAPEVVERLTSRGIEIARTDREGTISVRIALADGGRWSRMEP